MSDLPKKYEVKPDVDSAVDRMADSAVGYGTAAVGAFAARIARVFHALGDPTRRAILEMLSMGPQSVSKLAAPLGVTLTAVMQHLQILEECDLVRTEKIGRVRTCRIETSGFTVLEQWIRARKTPLERSLDRLAEFLAEDEAAK